MLKILLAKVLLFLRFLQGFLIFREDYNLLGITCFQIRSDTEQIPIKMADYWLGEG